MPRPKALRPQLYPSDVVAYLRVSTDEQAASGAGLSAQRTAIQSYAERTGAVVTRWCVDDGVSGSVAPADRPALREALAVLSIQSGVLTVAKLDRLARKASDLLGLRDRAEREGWSLAAADGSVDTATPHGRAMTSVMAAFAELERDLIRSRTKDALAALKAQGRRLGSPSALPADLLDRIVSERAAGRTLDAIAGGLAGDGIPTVKGGARWYRSTIAAALRTAELDKYADDRRNLQSGELA